MKQKAAMLDWLYDLFWQTIDWLQTYNGAVTAFATFWIAVFTIVLALVSRRQTRLTRESINLATKEFVAGHRPRIVLRDIHLIDESVLYMLVNIGDTRATVVESWILIEFVPEGRVLRPLRSFGHDDLGRLVFEAGEMKDLTFTVPGKLATEIRFPDITRIGIGEAVIPGQRYFTGTIVYEDDLRIRRRSVFRRKLNLESKNFERLSPGEERDHEYSD